MRHSRLLRRLLPMLLLALTLFAAQAEALDLQTATIADLQAAMAGGKLSSVELTHAYLKRVEAYDKKGPRLNAVILLNPKALDAARELDRERKSGKLRGPLHGIPIVLKDNYDTFDLPTTAGSLLLRGSVPPDDAFVVKKLREAGAVILAKVNLSEFASGAGTNGFSSLGGQTLNPHDLTRGPAGSSGGTGASIAAGFAQFGLGTDTGGSIRGPSSANGIVGLKPTLGLTSRNGVVPLALSFDTTGPMARSVYDVAAALSVIAGVDPGDAATAAAAGYMSADYIAALKTGALKGARIGYTRDFSGQDTGTDAVMDSAVAKLRELGAEVVDLKLPEYLIKAKAPIYQAINPPEFKAQIAEYLATLQPGFPRTLAELIAKAESIGPAYTNPGRLEAMKKSEASGSLDNPEYIAARDQGRAFMRAAVLAAMKKNRVDVIVYPTSPKPAQPITPPSEGASAAVAAAGRSESAANIANETGFPDLIVPAGMTPEGLPVTISFLGPAFSEAKLLGYGYDFEQATHAIRQPKYTPALVSDTLE